MSEVRHTVDPKFTYYDKRARKDVVLYVGLLDAAHRGGLVSVHTEILAYPHEDNQQTCIVRATVILRPDPASDVLTFTAIGDANPKNVGAAIAPHFIRMAETRAKARALRDALNIGMVTAEELGAPEDDDGHAASQPARRDMATPPPAFTRPRETPAAPLSDADIAENLQLLTIHDGARDPDARWDALWDYYDRAGDVADLNRRAERVKASGIPERDLRAAYKQKHSALAQLLAPAAHAG